MFTARVHKWSARGATYGAAPDSTTAAARCAAPVPAPFMSARTPTPTGKWRPTGGCTPWGQWGRPAARTACLCANASAVKWRARAGTRAAQLRAMTRKHQGRQRWPSRVLSILIDNVCGSVYFIKSNHCLKMPHRWQLDFQSLVNICNVSAPTELRLYEDEYRGNDPSLGTVYLRRKDLANNGETTVVQKPGCCQELISKDVFDCRDVIGKFCTLCISLPHGSFIEMSKFNSDHYYIVLTVADADKDAEQLIAGKSKCIFSKIEKYQQTILGDNGPLCHIGLRETQQLVDCDNWCELIYAFPSPHNMGVTLKTGYTEAEAKAYRQKWSAAAGLLKNGQGFFPHFYDVVLDGMCE